MRPASRAATEARIAPARRLVTLVVTVAAILAAASPAAAQTAPYAPQAPTKGALYTDGQDNRYLLGGTWLYRPDPGDVGISQGFWRDSAATTGWTGVSVPNSYNAGDFSAASMAGSVGWYRRDFTLPANAFARYVPRADRRWIVRFESVNYTATVWINGHQIGTHAGAYLPFEFDLRYLRTGVNRLVVRVDDRRNGGDLPAGPGGGWWNYGGIQREVYLRAVQRADIAQVQMRPVLPCPSCAATIEAGAEIRNPTASTQTVSLTGVYGPDRLHFGSHQIPAGGTWAVAATARLAHPRLWAPGSPYLYRARLVLHDAHGHQIGGYTVLSGVRSIKVTPGGRLALNGRLLNLRGVDIHEQTLTTGAALSATQLANEIAWTRALGAGVIRSHYPLNQQTIEAADRDGILIWSEVPVYGVADSYLDQPAWLARAEAVLRNNILTNQNHPSVMLWSIGNELPTPATDAETTYIKVASAYVRQLDPTRPVGMAVSDWPGVACQAAYRPLDAIGFNDYFGWFDAGGGTTDDRDELSPFLDSFRNCYPTKALFVTEFGFEGNRDGPVEERGTYQFQSDSVAFHLGVFASKPWLSGAMYFALQDFAARPGWSGGDPVSSAPFVEKGLVSLTGLEKPAFDTVSAIYHATDQIAAQAGR